MTQCSTPPHATARSVVTHSLLCSRFLCKVPADLELALLFQVFRTSAFPDLSEQCSPRPLVIACCSPADDADPSWVCCPPWSGCWPTRPGSVWQDARRRRCGIDSMCVCVCVCENVCLHEYLLQKKLFPSRVKEVVLCQALLSAVVTKQLVGHSRSCNAA
eukprot:scpid6921/ scgid20211/ 